MRIIYDGGFLLSCSLLSALLGLSWTATCGTCPASCHASSFRITRGLIACIACSFNDIPLVSSIYYSFSPVKLFRCFAYNFLDELVHSHRTATDQEEYTGLGDCTGQAHLYIYIYIYCKKHLMGQMRFPVSAAFRRRPPVGETRMEIPSGQLFCCLGVEGTSRSSVVVPCNQLSSAQLPSPATRKTRHR